MNMNSTKKKLRAAWGHFNDFLASEFSSLLKKKLINYLIEYTLYLLIILCIAYASYQLGYELILNFSEHLANEDFPFILTFAEHLFLYFLPIFVLFGFLKYYQFDLRRYLTDAKNDPDKRAEEQLELSKELFFSSVLSFSAIKIIEKLFFRYEEVKDYTQLIAIGTFFLLLAIFVLFQHSLKRHNNIK